MTSPDYTIRPLTASEKGDQDEQMWRAARKRAAWEAEKRTRAQAQVIEMRQMARRAG